VDSPTYLLTQVVTVTTGNGDWVRITAESGQFLVTGNLGISAPALVAVYLSPCATHHLEVTGHVREMGGDCGYGGYTLSTTYDRFGSSLVIVQGSMPCHLHCLPLVLRQQR
jgi:hypothetical protein